jgi:2-desacetyl-2-hydroxyethyl bacteriochlorophyllide A dehydrogenase
MRSAQLINRACFQVVETAAEEPGPGQVQVRVQAVGICGSDLLSYRGGIGGVECRYPLVPGHEPTGIVVKAGAGVTGWSAGDRVALEPALYCYHCEFCRAGRHNICRNIQFHSAEGLPGFLRELVSLPAENLLPLPAGVGFAEGTLFEPLAVALHSMKSIAVQPMESAAVFGAGPIGLLTIALLKLSGAGRIWAVDPVAHRCSLARAVGASAVLDPHAVDAAREILRDTGYRGVDVSIDCAARENSLEQCVTAVRNGGRMVVTGIPFERQAAIDWHVARRKELTIYNVRRSNHESPAALQLLAERPACFRPLITHVLPLEQVQPGFDMLGNYADGVGKLVIRCGQEI